MKLIVLLSTYNGEKYLREQLDSLVLQTLVPDKIFIRDDESSDSTLDILEEYSKKYSFIEYYQGNNLRPAKSFWELLKKCENADYYAFCDQDDYWLKDKLKTAVDMLNKEDNSIPLLYCSKFTLTDENLNPMDSKVSKLYNYTDFAHSLMYHTAPGCTFVFNHKARMESLKYDFDVRYHKIHDAVVHKVVAMLGKVILDDSSFIYYRQHGNNEIGMNSGVIKTFLERIGNYLGGKMRNYRSNTAKALLDVYGNELSDDKKHLLELVAYYIEKPAYKLELIKKDCFKTHSINDIFLSVLIILNYV